MKKVQAPLDLSRTRELDSDELRTLALESIHHEETNPIDPLDSEHPKTKTFRSRVWQFWLEHAKRVSVHPYQVWVDLCHGEESAKKACKGFLRAYINSSTNLRPTLGPEEWHRVRTVNSASTVEDVWGALVTRVDQFVLKQKRQACRHPWMARIYELNFSSRHGTSRQNSPAYEIGNVNVAILVYGGDLVLTCVRQWIPLLAKELGLSLKQSFKKRELVDEDIVLILHILWSRAAHIHCTPTVRLAFHTAVIISGIGGFRSASVLGMKYSQVEFEWTRDKVNPQKKNLTANITIHHVKQQENKVQRDQKSTLTFSITFVPCKQICLLTALAARALQDNAFQNNYTCMEELLADGKPLQGNNVKLAWKDSMLDKSIIPICYNSYWRVWNRTMYVAGLRGEDGVRPYALRVGAGGKLDGTLNRAMANYIMSHSTEVFEKSYQASHISTNLMRIAFDSRAGDNDALIRSLSSAFSRRDPYAPIYLSKEELAEFEKREDLQDYRRRCREAQEANDDDLAERLKQRIDYLINFLEKLKLKENRRHYFETMDRLRGTHQSTAHLPPQLTESARRIREAPCFRMAVTVSGLMKADCNSVKLAKYMIAFLQERNLDAELRGSQDRKPVRCLLCSLTFDNSGNLSRHVSNVHFFEEEFACPECHRNGNHVVIGPSCLHWAAHVKLYHKQFIAPSVSRCSQPAYCPLCTKRFTESGFSRHACFKNESKLSYPFSCPECKRDGVADHVVITSFADWAHHVRKVHDGDDTVQGAIIRRAVVKRPASMLECGDFGRELKRVKDDAGEMYRIKVCQP